MPLSEDTTPPAGSRIDTLTFGYSDATDDQTANGGGNTHAVHLRRHRRQCLGRGAGRLADLDDGLARPDQRRRLDHDPDQRPVTDRGPDLHVRPAGALRAGGGVFSAPRPAERATGPMPRRIWAHSSVPTPRQTLRAGQRRRPSGIGAWNAVTRSIGIGHGCQRPPDVGPGDAQRRRRHDHPRQSQTVSALFGGGLRRCHRQPVRHPRQQQHRRGLRRLLPSSAMRPMRPRRRLAVQRRQRLGDDRQAAPAPRRMPALSCCRPRRSCASCRMSRITTVRPAA